MSELSKRGYRRRMYDVMEQKQIVKKKEQKQISKESTA